MKTTTLMRKRSHGSTDAEARPTHAVRRDAAQAPAAGEADDPCRTPRTARRWPPGVGLGISILVSLGLWALIALGAAMRFG
jgi:hypothetical protein